MLKVVHDAEASNENSTCAAGGSLLDGVVPEGARQMLAAALRAEVLPLRIHGSPMSSTGTPSYTQHDEPTERTIQ